MSTTESQPNSDSSPKSNSTAPSGVPILSKWQLTAALILVTLLPFLTVVMMYSTIPSFDDPVLEANVQIGPRAWPSRNDPNARIVPCVILKNPTDGSWNYLNMSVNHQFHFTHPDLVHPNDEVVVPLKFFHTKGNAYFPPESQKLKELTIYAQISTGARAILEVTGDELGFKPPKLQ
ncbi:MAG: hypothetical protein AB8B50_19410 [Pirellulaceae bacterium]